MFPIYHKTSTPIVALQNQADDNPVNWSRHLLSKINRKSSLWKIIYLLNHFELNMFLSDTYDYEHRRDTQKNEYFHLFVHFSNTEFYFSSC